MKNKTNLAGFATGGAVTALVGLAGNVQAIPTSIHNEPDAWVRAEEMAGRIGASTHSKTQVIYLGKLHPHPASPAVIPPSDPAMVVGTGSHLKLLPPNLGAVVQTAPTTVHSPAPISVPDGGTTALMLGGAFSGLALLKKKFKA